MHCCDKGPSVYLQLRLTQHTLEKEHDQLIGLMIVGQRQRNNRKRAGLDFFIQFSKRPFKKTFDKLG